MRPRVSMMRQDCFVLHRSEQGIALVTTLVILLIMTVLGMGAVAVTALENRIAGFQRTGESATSAAESCVGTSANIIKQTVVAGIVPAAFVSATGPVPTNAETGANPTLTQEIMGYSKSHVDVVTGSGLSDGPDYTQQVNGYTVLGDIDMMYTRLKPGTEDVFEMVYRVDCRATQPTVGTESRVVVVYICTFNGVCLK